VRGEYPLIFLSARARLCTENTTGIHLIDELLQNASFLFCFGLRKMAVCAAVAEVAAIVPVVFLCTSHIRLSPCHVFMTIGGGLDIFLAIHDQHEAPEAETNDSVRRAMIAKFQKWKHIESIHVREDSLHALVKEVRKNTELRMLLERLPRDAQAGRVVGAFSHNLPLFVTASACCGTHVDVRYVSRSIGAAMFDYPVALSNETILAQLLLEQKIREANQQLGSDEALL